MGVKVIGIGVEIEKITDIDYTKGTYVVDLKVYPSLVTPFTPFESLQQAITMTHASWSQTQLEIPSDYWNTLSQKWQSTLNVMKKYGYEREVVGSIEEMVYLRRLQEPYGETYHFDNATDDEEQFWQDIYSSNQPIPFPDGHCSHEALVQYERPLTQEEYENFQGGLELFGRNSGSPTAIYNERKELSYLSFRGAQIDFKPTNAEMYPFEIEMLNLQFYIPQSTRMSSQITFCIKDD